MTQTNEQSDVSSPSSTERRIEHLAAELHAKVLPAIFDAHAKSVDAAHAALERTNSQLRSRVEADWHWPKILFGVMAAAFTFVFGFNAASQYLATVAVSKQADEMEKRIAEAKNLLEKTDNKQAAFEESLREAIDDVRDEMTRAVKVSTAAHQVLALIDAARDQLVFRRNPHRASTYANRAAEVLAQGINEAVSRPPKPTPDGSPAPVASLTILESAVMSLRAQCSLEAEDIPSAISESGALIAKCADFSRQPSSNCHDAQVEQHVLNAFYYSGVAHLRKVGSEHQSGPGRDKDLDTAIDHLQHSIKGEEYSDLAALFLAAAHFTKGHFREAANLADRIGKQYQYDKGRLPAPDQARLVLATYIWNLSTICLDQAADLRATDDCDFDMRLIGLNTSVVLESLFDKADRERDTLNLGEEWSARFSEICKRVVYGLKKGQSGTCGEPAAAPAPAAAGPDPMPAPAPVTEPSA